MLPQVRRVVLGVFLALVVFAGSAAAECAWLLWEGSLVPGGGWRWVISGSYASAKDCHPELADFVRIKRATGHEVTEPRSGAAIYTDGQHSRGYLYCLPDTVDPRGPKGGTR